MTRDAEQRGYDRAIAEVVAWLRGQGITSCDMDGWWDTSHGAEYGQGILDAIEAGEHKP